ncbi:putative signal transducing protein [Longimicrobium sp.]|uniref:putative signal transducing protein n=1 Tax=Longimicrobium sp. TaxID=2029185 RepID=UPI003B3B96CB
MSVEAPEATFTCPRCGAEYAGGDACPSCGFLQAPVPCDDDPSRNAAYRCVLCGRTVCGSDPAGKRAALCDLHAHVPIIEGWAQVYTTGDPLEADLIVQNLQAEGIDAQVYSQKDDHAFPVDIGELSIVRVLAPVWEFGEAMDLVESYTSGDGEISDDDATLVRDDDATLVGRDDATLAGRDDVTIIRGDDARPAGDDDATLVR